MGLALVPNYMGGLAELGPIQPKHKFKIDRQPPYNFRGHGPYHTCWANQGIGSSMSRWPHSAAARLRSAFTVGRWEEFTSIISLASDMYSAETLRPPAGKFTCPEATATCK